MANTISGNAGVAGAAIALSGAASASTTSAADGTYSFAGLAAGAYVVTPTLAGVTFTPTHLNETIVASDITDANFVAQATVFAPSPNLSDTFHRPDSLTLGPNWTATTDINQSLNIVSNLCVSDAGTLFGENIYTGATFANDQFAAATIDLFDPGSGSLLEVEIRANLAATTGYFTNIFLNGGQYQIVIQDVVANVTLGVPFLFSGPPQPGDVLKLQAVGTLITAFYNGVPVVSGTSSATASGTPGIYMQPTATQTDTSVSLFSAGPASFSISGSAGAAGAGATITLTGTSSGTTTAAGGTGNYSFTGLGPGTYTVTPGLTGHAFSPTNRTFTITNGNISGADFILFTPSKSGSNSGTVMASGPRFATRIVSPNTSIIGTNLGTETRK